MTATHGTGGAIGGRGVSQPDMSKAEPSGAQIAPPNFLDIPELWWLRLLEVFASDDDAPQHSGRPGLVQLFQLCRPLRDLVLSQRMVLLRFSLPLSLKAAPAAVDKLVRACQSATKGVSLRFDTEYGRPLVDTEASATTLMFGALAKAGRGLDAVTSVKLAELELNAVVPSWLALTCPQLTSLEHHVTTVSALPAPAVSIPMGCQHIKQLALFVRHRHEDEQLMMPRWQHQLRALSGLTSLHITMPRHIPWFFGCCANAVGQQLTRLRWESRLPPADLARLPVLFPHLRDLRLGWTGSAVDDQGVEALLSMQLQRLHCHSFRLQHSYTHRPCSWKHLGFKCLDVSASSRMPLEGVQSLAAADGIILRPSSANDLGATSRVAATVARCGGITTDRPHIALDNGQSHADSTTLAATMAIVSSCKVSSFHMSHAAVTPELLAAIKQHLLSTQAAKVHLISCSYSPEVWPMLLTSLPPIRLLSLESWGDNQAEDVTEADVTAMCAHACHPVSVEVRIHYARGRWWGGWEERVQAAMAAAGHQLVQVQVFDEVSDAEGGGGEESSEEGEGSEEEGEGSEEEGEGSDDGL